MIEQQEEKGVPVDPGDFDVPGPETDLPVTEPPSTHPPGTAPPGAEPGELTPHPEPDEEPADRHQGPLDDPEDTKYLDPDDPRVRDVLRQRESDDAA